MGLRPWRPAVLHGDHLVTAMDDHDKLRAAHDRARARSLELLERTEHAAGEKGTSTVGTLGVEVEARDDDDDALVSWHRNMPQPEPARHERHASRERLTDSESQRWQAYIESRIAAAIKQHGEIWREITAQAIAHERQLFRAELAKVDLRLSALIGELTKRRIESEERADVVPLKFFGRRRHA
jgi:hypothetical protein